MAMPLHKVGFEAKALAAVGQCLCPARLLPLSIPRQCLYYK